jgi:hypothetical protein
MATTVQNVFDYTMSLIDERLESGLVDPSSTLIFQKNTPYILTTLQDELIQDSDYYKTFSITKVATENVGGYQEYDMPTDFHTEQQIIKVNGGYKNASDFKWENKKLFIPDKFAGTIKVVYYPIPEPLTEMTDELVLDDITCRTVLVNGLASRLLTNENRVLANYFNDLYNELKNKAKRKKLAQNEPIEDRYDSKMTY